MIVTTSLFDIGRSSWARYSRDTSSYLEHSKNMLSLRCKMVIYTTEDLRSHFEAERMKHDPSLSNTRIVCMPLSSIPYYDYLDRLNDLMKSEYFVTKIRNSGGQDGDRPEANSALYNIIQFAKSKFVEKTIDSRFFDDDIHCWMDAGIYHHRFPQEFLNRVYPSKNESVLLDGKIHQFYKDFPRQSDLNKVVYYGSHEDVRIVGAWFGGTSAAMKLHSQRVNKVVDDSIREGVISDDQNIYTVAYLERKDLYSLHDGSFAHSPWFAGLDFFL